MDPSSTCPTLTTRKVVGKLGRDFVDLKNIFQPIFIQKHIINILIISINQTLNLKQS